MDNMPLMRLGIQKEECVFNEDRVFAFGLADFEVPIRHMKLHILQAIRYIGLKCGERRG